MSWFSVFLTIMTKRTFWRYRVLGDGKRFVKTRTIKTKHIQKNVKSKVDFALWSGWVTRYLNDEWIRIRATGERQHFSKILRYKDIAMSLPVFYSIINSIGSLKIRLSVVFLIIFEQLFVCRRHAEARIRNQKKEKTTNGALWLVKLVSFSRWRTESTRFRSTNKLQVRLLSSRWLFRSRSKLGRVQVNLQFLTSQIFCHDFFCGELPFLLTLWCWHKKRINIALLKT